MSVVLKIKQLQNLKFNSDSVEKWQQVREDEINQRMEILQNKETVDGNDDPVYLEK